MLGAYLTSIMQRPNFLRLAESVKAQHCNQLTQGQNLQVEVKSLGADLTSFLISKVIS